jgi:hypothetical protein
MSLPQNLLALCETMLPGENQRGRPDAATLKRCISTAYYSVAYKDGCTPSHPRC